MKSKSVIYYFILLLMFCSCASEQESERHSPNILFILADDLGYNDLSCMGSPYYETPNIDKIADQGMIFTNGYSACQVCSPSRASLLTGKFPARHGITDWLGAKTGEDWRKQNRFNKLLPPDYEPHLAFEDLTMAEAFQEQGYKTFFAGKWHLGKEGSYPEDHGFDMNKGGFEAGGPYTGGFFSPFNNPKLTDFPKEKGISLPMKLANETSQFITAHKDEPFFAYLSFYAVHAPIQSSEVKWKKFRDKAETMGIADHGFEMERRFPIRVKQDNPVYAGLIQHMDDAVGRVLQTLKEHGLDDNTIVIFTSDNGGVTSGDHFSTSLLPLRGGKGYQWEGGVRIPFLIHVPWMNHNGKQNHTPVIGTDFYPSLLELAGLELQDQQHLDGKSLAPVLQGDEMEERPLIWHYPHYGNQGGDPSSMIRQGKWKLIHYWEDDSNELYNLENDIGELKNIAAQYPEKAEKLWATLSSYLETMQAKTPRQDPIFHPDSLAMKHREYQTTWINKLEKQRKNFLDPNWKPNEDWWGSMVVD